MSSYLYGGSFDLDQRQRREPLAVLLQVHVQHLKHQNTLVYVDQVKPTKKLDYVLAVKFEVHQFFHYLYLGKHFSWTQETVPDRLFIHSFMCENCSEYFQQQILIPITSTLTARSPRLQGKFYKCDWEKYHLYDFLHIKCEHLSVAAFCFNLDLRQHSNNIFSFYMTKFASASNCNLISSCYTFHQESNSFSFSLKKLKWKKKKVPYLIFGTGDAFGKFCCHNFFGVSFQTFAHFSKGAFAHNPQNLKLIWVQFVVRVGHFVSRWLLSKYEKNYVNKIKRFVCVFVELMCVVCVCATVSVKYYLQVRYICCSMLSGNYLKGSSLHQCVFDAIHWGRCDVK